MCVGPFGDWEITMVHACLGVAGTLLMETELLSVKSLVVGFLWF